MFPFLEQIEISDTVNYIEDRKVKIGNWVRYNDGECFYLTIIQSVETIKGKLVLTTDTPISCFE